MQNLKMGINAQIIYLTRVINYISHDLQLLIHHIIQIFMFDSVFKDIQRR